MLKEWPLVVFTILGQMAVGIILLIFLPLSLATEIPWTTRSRSSWLMLTALIFGLLVIAAALSFFHVHHPFRARRVLSNLRTSWLSREIFFEIAFMGFVALSFVLVWRENTEFIIFKAVMGAAALAGIMFLVSMSKLYMLESVPPWDSWYTGLSFSLTAGTLGAMVTAWVIGPSLGHSNIPGLRGMSLLFIAADALFAALITPQYGIGGSRTVPSLRPPARASRLLHFGRLGLLAGGLILLAAGLWNGAGTDLGPIQAIAFTLVFAGEVAGRFLFYGLVPRPGD